MLRRRLIWTLALVVFGLAVPAEGGVGLVELQSASSWEGLQFLGTDSRQRVFVLDSATLTVHRLTPEGVEDGFELETVAGDGAVGPRLAAAMGESSGDWLLRTGAFEVRWFRGREEKPVPPTPWLVQDVLLVEGNPVVALAPVRGSFGLSERDEAPLLAGLAGQDWNALFRPGLAADEKRRSADSNERQAAYRHHRWRIALHLAAAPDGRIWIADRHVARLRELTESGSLRTTVTLGPDPRMEIGERSSEEMEEIRKAAAEAGRRLPPSTPGLKERPVKTILGMTAAWDGRVYLVTPGTDGPQLVRWNPLLLVWETAPLEGELPSSSNLDLAAGRDGLYLAQRGDEMRRWFVPWEALEGAEWQPPEETKVYLDGMPLEQLLPPSDG